jgi:hypothetical protein
MVRKGVSVVVFLALLVFSVVGIRFGIGLIDRDQATSLAPQNVSQDPASDQAARSVPQPAGEMASKIEIGGGAYLQQDASSWEMVLPKPPSSIPEVRHAFEPVGPIDLGAGHTLVADGSGYRIRGPGQARLVETVFKDVTRIDIGSGYLLEWNAGGWQLQAYHSTEPIAFASTAGTSQIEVGGGFTLVCQDGTCRLQAGR